jgi:hypothetical protein
MVGSPSQLLNPENFGSQTEYFEHLSSYRLPTGCPELDF